MHKPKLYDRCIISEKISCGGNIALLATLWYPFACEQVSCSYTHIFAFLVAIFMWSLLSSFLNKVLLLPIKNKKKLYDHAPYKSD